MTIKFGLIYFRGIEVTAEQYRKIKKNLGVTEKMMKGISTEMFLKELSEIQGGI